MAKIVSYFLNHWNILF